MENILFETLKQSPALLAIVVIIYMFVEFIKTMGKYAIDKMDALNKEHREHMAHIIERYAVLEKSAQESRDKQVQAIAENTIATHEMTRELKSSTCKYNEKR